MFVYLLLCRDGSIYTGTAHNLEKRMRDHFERTAAVAAYTRAKGARYLLAAWECDTRSAALRAEYAVKQLTHKEKEALAASPEGISALARLAAVEETYRPLSATDPRLLAIRTAYPDPQG